METDKAPKAKGKKNQVSEKPKRNRKDGYQVSDDPFVTQVGDNKDVPQFINIH
jgi:hypothetical protein